MAKERSPNYPGIALSSAVELVKRLFDKERRSVVAVEEAVGHWGHESLSGPARVRVAALRQYGLIDVMKDNKIRVSDLGLTVCIPPDERDYKAALKEAALSPPLFQQLWTTMRDASDGNIRHFLMRERGFSLDGAIRVIKSYRASIAFANLSGESYDDDSGQENGEDTAMIAMDNRPAPNEAASTRTMPAPGATFRFGPLPSGAVVEIAFNTPRFTVQDVEFLKEYLTLQARGLQMAEELRRSAATSQSDSSESEWQLAQSPASDRDSTS
jgi:hypothetical protein